jgi:hypothetical protein
MSKGSIISTPNKAEQSITTACDRLNSYHSKFITTIPAFCTAKNAIKTEKTNERTIKICI